MVCEFSKDVMFLGLSHRDTTNSVEKEGPGDAPTAPFGETGTRSGKISLTNALHGWERDWNTIAGV